MKCPYCKTTIAAQTAWQQIEHIKECENNQGKLELYVSLGYAEDEKAVIVELKADSFWTLKEKLDRWLDFVKVDLNL